MKDMEWADDVTAMEKGAEEMEKPGKRMGEAIINNGLGMSDKTEVRKSENHPHKKNETSTTQDSSEAQAKRISNVWECTSEEICREQHTWNKCLRSADCTIHGI